MSPRKASRARRTPAQPQPHPQQVSSPAWPFAALIVLAAALAYANSLSGPFILDDYAAIVNNQTIRHWWNLAAVFAPPPELPVSGRPIANLSFALTYAVSGLNLQALHLWNIGIHALNGLLLFGIVRRTADIDEREPARRLRIVALSAALLWTVHPLNTEAVDYLTQRTELLLGSCYFLTMYASARAFAGKRSRMWTAIAVTACGIGMGCKESMVTAPVMVLLYDRTFASRSLGQALSKRWRFHAALFSTWAILLACLWSAPRAASAGFSSGVNATTYLWNQATVVLHYLRLAVWPRGLVVDYGWPVPLGLADVAPQVLILLAVLLFTAVAVTRWPRVGFLCAWFFVTIAPTSSIVPIATEVGAERRMYLPLAGLMVLLAALMLAASDRLLGSPARSDAGPTRDRRHRVMVAAVAVLAIGLASETFARNREYASSLLLATTVVERWPSAVAHATLGTELSAAGRHEEAIVHLKEAVRGGDTRALFPLGGELFDRGDFDQAVRYLQEFVDYGKPPAALALGARKMIGTAYFQRGKWSEAVAALRIASSGAPSDASIKRLLADALFAQHDYENAAAEYQAVAQTQTPDVDLLTNLGIALAATGRNDEAMAAFRRAVSTDPRSAGARINVVQMLLQQQRVGEAEAEARAAVAALPGDARLRELLDRAVALQRKR